MRQGATIGEPEFREGPSFVERFMDRDIHEIISFIIGVDMA